MNFAKTRYCSESGYFPVVFLVEKSQGGIIPEWFIFGSGICQAINALWHYLLNWALLGWQMSLLMLDAHHLGGEAGLLRDELQTKESTTSTYWWPNYSVFCIQRQKTIQEKISAQSDSKKCRLFKGQGKRGRGRERRKDKKRGREIIYCWFTPQMSAATSAGPDQSKSQPGSPTWAMESKTTKWCLSGYVWVGKDAGSAAGILLWNSMPKAVVWSGTHTQESFVYIYLTESNRLLGADFHDSLTDRTAPIPAPRNQWAPSCPKHS